MAGDWNDLKFFLAVARSGRLTAAARRLNVNHSTVERRITALEDALQVKLFERRPVGFELSPKGNELLPYAEEMESRWLTAAAAVSGSDLELSGTVRLGAPDGLGTFFLAPRLARLGKKYPALDLELIAMPLVLNPSKREADIAIGFARPTHGHLISRKLTDYALHLYASRDFVAEHGEPKTLDDLKALPLFGYIRELVFVRELDYLNEVADGLNPRLTSTNIVAQYMMTLHGKGICILPHFMVADEPRLVRILPEVEIIRSYHLIFASNLAQLARIRLLIDLLSQWVKDSRAILLP